MIHRGVVVSIDRVNRLVWASAPAFVGGRSVACVALSPGDALPSPGEAISVVQISGSEQPAWFRPSTPTPSPSYAPGLYVLPDHVSVGTSTINSSNFGRGIWWWFHDRVTFDAWGWEPGASGTLTGTARLGLFSVGVDMIPDRLLGEFTPEVLSSTSVTNNMRSVLSTSSPVTTTPGWNYLVFGWNGSLNLSITTLGARSYFASSTLSDMEGTVPKFGLSGLTGAFSSTPSFSRITGNMVKVALRVKSIG